MPNFAVLDGENVLNIITAESKEIAEQIFNTTCIEISVEDFAEPGGTYVNGIFRLKQPYPSWILSSDNMWEAPIPYPEIELGSDEKYIWDENTTSWLLLPPSN